jgi:NAD(P)-dependent dehydrogenase (short-subunit alcohol dehydrogenase family)
MNETTFEGRTVLVTGAARGIGRATAERFADAGAFVVLVDRDGDEAEAVAKIICGTGRRALAIAADVADGAAVRAAVDVGVRAFGRLDVLVNNAGIHFARAIDEYTDEEIDRLLSVNLKGALHAVRAAVPHLRTSRGSIVSVSSMTGLVGQDRGAVYVATKGALISLTKALALELAPDGVRVNCVCPAGVDTPLMRSWAATLPNPEAVLRDQAAMHLMNRLATPEEIAEAIAFLASPSAAFITGIALPVDGGATLGYRRQ